MSTRPKLTLKPEPDGYGFIYGDLYIGDAHHTVNIMPPEHEWRGQIRLDGYAPHPTDWVIYVDGDEVARVTKREDVEQACLALPRE